MPHHLPSFSDLKSLFSDLWLFAKIVSAFTIFGFNCLAMAFLLNVTQSIFSIPGFMASELGVLALIDYYIREKKQEKNQLKGHDGIYERAEKERAKTKPL